MKRGHHINTEGQEMKHFKSVINGIGENNSQGVQRKLWGAKYDFSESKFTFTVSPA